MGHKGELGWRFLKQLVSSTLATTPAVQIADLVASTAVRIFSRGLPEGFEATAEMMDEGMLRDSIFPDWGRDRSDAKGGSGKLSGTLRSSNAC